jgi:hypothetical protein
LAAAVSAKTKVQCPDITGNCSFATLDHFDVVDFVKADDPKQIEKCCNDHACLWAFDNGNAGRKPVVEGISVGARIFKPISFFSSVLFKSLTPLGFVPD